MCLSVTLSVGVLLFQRISENTGFNKKTFRYDVSEAIIPFNCNLLQSVVYQKPFRAIEGNFSLRNIVSESYTDKQRTGGGKDSPRFELGL